MKRDFKGIWIPKEIWECKELSALEKVLAAEINSLDASGCGCFASNAYFAEFLGVNERTVQKFLKSLKEVGVVKEVGFDGRKRNLTSDLNSLRCERGVQNDAKIVPKRASPPCPKGHPYNKVYNKVDKENLHHELISSADGGEIIDADNKPKGNLNEEDEKYISLLKDESISDKVKYISLLKDESISDKVKEIACRYPFEEVENALFNMNALSDAGKIRSRDAYFITCLKNKRERVKVEEPLEHIFDRLHDLYLKNIEMFKKDHRVVYKCAGHFEIGHDNHSHSKAFEYKCTGKQREEAIKLINSLYEEYSLE